MRNLRFVKRMTALAMALMFLVAANVKRVEAAPANNLTPEQIEAIVTDVFNKFAAFDAQGTAALTSQRIQSLGPSNSAILRKLS